jgi:hypothetical protein
MQGPSAKPVLLRSAWVRVPPMLGVRGAAILFQVIPKRYKHGPDYDYNNDDVGQVFGGSTWSWSTYFAMCLRLTTPLSHGPIVQ